MLADCLLCSIVILFQTVALMHIFITLFLGVTIWLPFFLGKNLVAVSLIRIMISDWPLISAIHSLTPFTTSSLVPSNWSAF